jgi:hypothetical protein
MIISLTFGSGRVETDKVYKIDCPNKMGGIGDITIKPLYSLWTGDAHIYIGSKISFNFGEVTLIETRSNSDETNEKWKVLWKKPQYFKYKAYFEAAKILNKLIKKK